MPGASSALEERLEPKGRPNDDIPSVMEKAREVAGSGGWQIGCGWLWLVTHHASITIHNLA